MRNLFLVALFIAGTIGGLFAQRPVMVQGHERTDVPAPHTRSAAQRSVEDETFTFDDITFWVGNPKGENRAALVIDWFDDKGGTLVWGFRWTGEATGADMVKAVAKADPRFLFLTHGTNLGSTIAGLGYDLNNNGNQYLIFDNDATNPHYPVEGAVTTDAYNYDDWTINDPASHWRAGWYSGYWSYQVKDSQEDDFGYSGLGASSRLLQDGSWDGWGYQSFDNPSMEGSIPRTPWTAVPVPVIAVTDVELSQSVMTIEKGELVSLYARVVPAHATNQQVTWSSNDDRVASVDRNGWIKANEPGSAAIYATSDDGQFSKACFVTVVVATGVDEADAPKTRIYPTVTTGVVHIEQADSPDVSPSVAVFSPSGVLLQAVTVSRRATIDLGNYAPGIYYIKVGAKTTKVVKR